MAEMQLQMQSKMMSEKMELVREKLELWMEGKQAREMEKLERAISVHEEVYTTASSTQSRTTTHEVAPAQAFLSALPFYPATQQPSSSF